MESQYLSKRKMESIVPMANEEAIKLSRFPDATRHEVYRPPPIEREDWPGPPATAAAYPELCKLTMASHKQVQHFVSMGKWITNIGIAFGQWDSTCGGHKSFALKSNHTCYSYYH